MEMHWKFVLAVVVVLIVLVLACKSLWEQNVVLKNRLEAAALKKEAAAQKPSKFA
jgi:hypothetical protein